jgi:hypothetical protein
VGDVGLLDALARDREAGDLERELRGDHVMRELRGRPELRVETDEQLELLHRGDGLALIGPGGDGIAAETDEGADALLAFVEDLVGERGRREPRGGVAERTRAQRFALAPARARRRGPGPCPRAGGSSAPGFGTRSPARRQRPQSVLSASSRYSVRLPRGAMLGPVPATAQPRGPAAKSRAAATICPASTPARTAAHSGVQSATVRASASKPDTFARRRAHRRGPRGSRRGASRRGSPGLRPRAAGGRDPRSARPRSGADR